LLFEFDGDAIGRPIGFTVSGIPDVNGDGDDDVILGGPVAGGPIAGSTALVFSGTDRTVLVNATAGLFDSIVFGVDNAGDVNGDGVADIVAGAPTANGNFGLVRVFSGADGSVLLEFNGDAAGDLLGFSVSGAGDVDDDGQPDVIVGAASFIRILSGADGSTLFQFAGEVDRGGVSGAGDVNGDGHDDVIVGERALATPPQTARVLSGADGSTIFEFENDVPLSSLGARV